MELGIYTFAELTPDPARAGRSRPSSGCANLIEEIELADQVGLDVFGVGEHHRPDFAVSAPAVVLAAAAARTERIRLTSAVTRAQLRRPGPRLPGVRDARPALGRPRRDHGRPRLVHRVVPALRLRPRRLRRAVRREARAAAAAARAGARHVVRPPPRAARRPRRLPAARCRTRSRSGSRSAAPRSRPCAPATLGLPMALAIIGGLPERFAPFAELHRRAAARGRPRAAGAEHQLARLRRRHLAGGGRRRVAVVRGDDGPDRPRARLAADDARAVRRRRARCAARTSSAARRR